MTRRTLCIAALFAAAGCAKGGGNTAPVVEAFNTCRAPNPQPAATQSAGVQAFAASAVETGEKVVLENLHAIAPHALGVASAASETVLPAGTRVSVTLKESCHLPGAISSELLSSRSAGSASPAGVRSYTWQIPNELELADLKAIASRDDCVVGISDSVVASISAKSDPMSSAQGHLATLEVEAGLAHMKPQSDSKPVVIAVVDTGADLRHEDLQGVLWENEKEIPGNDVDDDGNGYVDDLHGFNFALDIGDPSHSGDWAGFQHGTHVAGLAAAQSGNSIGGRGVAFGAKLMILNVFGKDSGAFSADIANAIRYAADNGADVINLSVGGVGKSGVYRGALEYAINKGVVILAAAGNERRELTDNYFMSPAGYAVDLPGMLAVASVDSRNLEISVFSNFGRDFIELAAPGAESSREKIGLLSTFPRDGYSRLQGTSMASPVAAGSAALAIRMMRDRGYEPSPATIEALLEVSAHRSTALNEKVRGGRIVNVRMLAEFVDSTYPLHEEGTPLDPGVPGFDPCN